MNNHLIFSTSKQYNNKKKKKKEVGGAVFKIKTWIHDKCNTQKTKQLKTEVQLGKFQ